eukprot:6522214-Pyramimonas_sp.AAC.1
MAHHTVTLRSAPTLIMRGIPPGPGASASCCTASLWVFTMSLGSDCSCGRGRPVLSAAQRGALCPVDHPGPGGPLLFCIDGDMRASQWPASERARVRASPDVN